MNVFVIQSSTLELRNPYFQILFSASTHGFRTIPKTWEGRNNFAHSRRIFKQVHLIKCLAPKLIKGGLRALNDQAIPGRVVFADSATAEA